jgi:hypothetical protein
MDDGLDDGRLAGVETVVEIIGKLVFFIIEQFVFIAFGWP